MSSACRWAARSVVAAVELLKLIAHAFEREALLIDLAIERAALRRRGAENGEET